jgi:pimeloyl-ACP methyl ester carboxylesterase
VPCRVFDRAFATVLFAVSFAGLAPSPAAAGTADFVTVPGGKLWYEVEGAGDALVFLHDGLLPSATWDGQLAYFARRFRAVRYDRRGYGRSEPATAEFSDLDDLAALLDHLGIAKTILVGCSSGSRIAVDFALAHPDRVTGLVLVGPIVSGFPHSAHFDQRGLLNFQPLFGGQRGEKDVSRLVDNWVRDPFLTAAGSTAAKARLRELMTANPTPATGALREGKPVARPALGRLGELRKPVLLVVGESDIPDVHANAGALEAGIANSRRVVVEKAGHLVQLEQPEAFNEVVLTFLRPGVMAAEYLKTLSSERIFADGQKLLEVDRRAPLDVHEGKTETRGEVKVVDLTYASPLGGRVPAYLVLPPGSAPHPAVLFVHPGQGNRSTFLAEATELAAEHGIAGLLLDAPFARPGYTRPRNPWDPEANRREQLQSMLDVRRGFDLLAERPEVDASRLAFVGHSFGATIGGTVAGVEARPIAWVLMAGYASYTHASLAGQHRGAIAFRTLLTPAERQAYVDAMAPLDAVHYVGHAAGRFLFQFAHHDEFITPWDAGLYLAATKAPKTVKWYDTDHFFNETAKTDRDAWLAEVLAVAPAVPQKP